MTHVLVAVFVYNFEKERRKMLVVATRIENMRYWEMIVNDVMGENCEIRNI